MANNSQQTKKFDSDADIRRKLDVFVNKSDKEAKQAVTKAAKLYEGNLKANTPVHKKQTHKQHAKDVTKISNFSRNATYPEKIVGFDMGKKRSDGGWYIHFPDVGTEIRGEVGQPAQHFIERTHEMSKAPILAIYKHAMRNIFDE